MISEHIFHNFTLNFPEGGLGTGPEPLSVGGLHLSSHSPLMLDGIRLPMPLHYILGDQTPEAYI